MAAAAAAAATQAPLVARKSAVRTFQNQGLSGALVEVSPDRFLSEIARGVPSTVLLYSDAFSQKYAATIDRKLLYTESRWALTFPADVKLQQVR